MLVSHAPDLGGSSTFKEWISKIEKVDDQTVEFTLNKPNPRFQLDYFSVKIWGGRQHRPQAHLGRTRTRSPSRTMIRPRVGPLFTGPYKLNSFSRRPSSTTIRDDNWWGAKTGFKPLPAPKKLIWTWAGPEETRAALMADEQARQPDGHHPGRVPGPAGPEPQRHRLVQGPAVRRCSIRARVLSSSTPP